MSNISPTPRRKKTGIWSKTIASTLRDVRPKHREPLPTDILRLVVDILIHHDKSLAYSLGLVCKSFRTWVLQSLYDVVVFTSPAHVHQVLTVTLITGTLAHHVRHISLVRLEMHIYGALEREEGLYKALERFLTDCDSLETLLYDFKRVPLPFSVSAPQSLTNIYWSHPSRDGWLGCETLAMKHVTHLRVDCTQNDVRNAATFSAMLPSSPRLTHVCFGVDARMQTSQVTAAFVRGLLQRPQMTRVVVMAWHYGVRSHLERVLFDELRALRDPRICVLLSPGPHDEASSLIEWEDAAHGGSSLWHRAETIMEERRHKDHVKGENLKYDLAVGSFIIPTRRQLLQQEGYTDAAPVE